MNNINSNQKTVLVTGASSGLGALTAQLLAERGYRVAGAARRSHLVAELPGVLPVQLDLSDESSIDAAVSAVEAELGPVEVLINNAGYGEFGSVEETPLDRARRQFDVNVFGLAALTRRVIGPMRDAGRGRIVNVSSLAGEFSSPLGGWYHASKFALEALSDSMRAELRPFGIDVAVVQPGPVRTAWHGEAMRSLEASSGGGPYADMAAAVAGYHRASADAPITSDAGTVARVIARAATEDRPRTRYRVGRGSSTAVALSRLPDRMFDAMTRRQFGIP
ncbi:NAD(P)-dependent dehydrogenase (short-subunit alcohol dehydrogenase family) [Arthrobacter stackebrandtii]|uniref:NAD(P)-dependent dehydrogenase (Short-subunit alcohol dehydrogenase family) n=1 Tax=Arthrobacter stackebrandtii TaxID=272161 RepID=A0ABS4YVK7_9MICC|nr:NAD(P)-dependent dehydrogenase (short-subunit alcohol dehydrogenase family) [Arthrobacter stackebrandtii]